MQLRYQSKSSKDVVKRRSGRLLLVSTWLALLVISLGFVEAERQAAMPWSYKLFHLLMASTIVFNVVTHLRAAACRSPGFTCEVACWSAVEKYQLTWRWCKECQLPKPPRAHHCKSCGKCVLKLDHHCPWLDNCIGLHNYRSFVLLLFYTMLGCAYTAPWFWQAAFARGGKASFSSAVRSMHLNPSAPLLCLCVTLTAGAGCGVLLCWHLYLIATGQTTLEFYAARKSAKALKAQGQKLVRVYDLGLKENFKEVFKVGGQWGWLACILPSSPQLPPAGVGYALPTPVDWSSWEAPPVKRARVSGEVDCEAGAFFSPRSSPCRPHASRYFDGLPTAQQPPALVV